MDSDEDIPGLIDHEEISPQADSKRIPLTIISGFLGAGKSTLLQRILTEWHGYRIAVIMNEFGDTADIESKTINVSSDDPNAERVEEFLELANGCLCCSIKDSGIASIEKLMQRKGAFDYILLETTGLADPGPIASIFWQNEEFATNLGQDITLDGVVCLVDAVFGKKQMEEDHTVDGIGESLRQIACADVIVLNKVDLVQDAELCDIEDILHKVNPTAPVYRSIRAQVDLSHLIGLRAYASRPDFQHFSRVTTSMPSRDRHHDSHDTHNHEHAMSSAHYEVHGISSLQVSSPILSTSQLKALDEWIRSVLWEHKLPDHEQQHQPTDNDLRVLRCKGLFAVDTGEKYLLQGVQSMYDINPVEGRSVVGIPDEGKIVLIGKGLTGIVRQSLERILSSMARK